MVGIILTTFRFVSFIVEFDCSGPSTLDPYGRATPVAPDPPERESVVELIVVVQRLLQFRLLIVLIELSYRD